MLKRMSTIVVITFSECVEAFVEICEETNRIL